MLLLQNRTASAIIQQVFQPMAYDECFDLSREKTSFSSPIQFGINRLSSSGVMTLCICKIDAEMAKCILLLFQFTII